MSEDEPQMTESKAATRDRELCEKSADLCKHSKALIREARNLRQHSDVLRTINGFIAATNSHSTARRERELFKAIVESIEQSRQKIISINIPLGGFRQNSDEGLTIVDESKVLY